MFYIGTQYSDPLTQIKVLYAYARASFYNYANSLYSELERVANEMSRLEDILLGFFNPFERLVDKYRLHLFAKKNQGTVKRPGNGHVGNGYGYGSKRPDRNPAIQKGGQNGPPSK